MLDGRPCPCGNPSLWMEAGKIVQESLGLRSVWLSSDWCTAYSSFVATLGSSEARTTDVEAYIVLVPTYVLYGIVPTYLQTFCTVVSSALSARRQRTWREESVSRRLIWKRRSWHWHFPANRLSTRLPTSWHRDYTTRKWISSWVYREMCANAYVHLLNVACIMPE